MEQRAKDLIEFGDFLFSKTTALMSLWQEQADNFYVERADFTVTRSIGTDFAGNLTTSYPLLCRRDLGNILGQMLRPADKEWYEVSTVREDKQDDQAKKWLEWAGTIQRRAMYDREAQFDRATKEGDNDFATFGQCVLTVELTKNMDSLLYRCWHLRDVRWAENYKGVIDTVHRKWKPTVREAIKCFPGKMDAKIIEREKKEPYSHMEIRHVVCPAEDYSDVLIGKKWKTPFVSIFIDVENQCIIEEVGIWNLMYVIPRWQTVSGSQYAYSPATVCALPDARLIQAMTLVLLEAGEKAVTPPMVTPGGILRSDVNLYAGGLTAYDAEYDERLGEVLRPIPISTNGIQYGITLREQTQQMIYQAFMLNKVGLPPMNKEATAFEISQRVTEYVRNALPLFQPMESEYNGQLCDMSFDLLRRGGAFGNPRDIPQSIRGQDIQFRFESPLHAAIDAQKVAQFNQTRALLAEAAALDPAVVNMLDLRKSLRDALEGGGTPKGWLRSDSNMKELDAQSAQQTQTQQLLTTMGQGADVAQKIGAASQSLQGIPGRAGAKVQPQTL